ncbi:Hypothetical predicted protein [Octopus vulgaris]|uniref:Uncharacterized protein n=1 Tax=Octopus vulgaris TaxID=6645 RepID=A0AA36FBB2_OCTVU|nr:Hypothetical predicted protein [Octopus vulgaris]
MSVSGPCPPPLPYSAVQVTTLNANINKSNFRLERIITKDNISSYNLNDTYHVYFIGIDNVTTEVNNTIDVAIGDGATWKNCIYTLSRTTRNNTSTDDILCEPNAIGDKLKTNLGEGSVINIFGVYINGDFNWLLLVKSNASSEFPLNNLTFIINKKDVHKVSGIRSGFTDIFLVPSLQCKPISSFYMATSSTSKLIVDKLTLTREHEEKYTFLTSSHNIMNQAAYPVSTCYDDDDKLADSLLDDCCEDEKYSTICDRNNYPQLKNTTIGHTFDHVNLIYNNTVLSSVPMKNYNAVKSDGIFCYEKEYLLQASHLTTFPPVNCKSTKVSLALLLPNNTRIQYYSELLSDKQICEWEVFQQQPILEVNLNLRTINSSQMTYQLDYLSLPDELVFFFVFFFLITTIALPSTTEAAFQSILNITFPYGYTENMNDITTAVMEESSYTIDNTTAMVVTVNGSDCETMNGSDCRTVQATTGSSSLDPDVSTTPTVQSTSKSITLSTTDITVQDVSSESDITVSTLPTTPENTFTPLNSIKY